MTQLLSYLKSRTVLTIIVLVVVNGVPAVRELIPVLWLPVIDVILGALGVYFRVKPRQTYNVTK